MVRSFVSLYGLAINLMTELDGWFALIAFLRLCVLFLLSVFRFLVLAAAELSTKSASNGSHPSK